MRYIGLQITPVNTEGAVVPYRPEAYHRGSIRLAGYDDAQPGSYFVTITLQNRKSLFGRIADGEMRLNDAGKMVAEVWATLPERFTSIESDIYMVMPNHFHGIITIVGASLVGAQPNEEMDYKDSASKTGAGTRPAPTHLGKVTGAFKSITTVQYVRGAKELGWRPFAVRLWQRNYYEHVIRNEHSLQRIREYIRTNPERWHLDRENSNREGKDDFDVWLESKDRSSQF